MATNQLIHLRQGCMDNAPVPCVMSCIQLYISAWGNSLPSFVFVPCAFEIHLIVIDSPAFNVYPISGAHLLLSAGFFAVYCNQCPWYVS